MAASHIMRSPVSPDSGRATVAIAELDALVSAADRAAVDAQVNIVSSAPGPALLVCGREAVCSADTGHSGASAGMRSGAVGKPLLKVQPELERFWRQKLE